MVEGVAQRLQRHRTLERPGGQRHRLLRQLLRPRQRELALGVLRGEQERVECARPHVLDETRIGARVVLRLPVRLGVVVGEELDEFAPALTGGLLDPPGHAFVSVRSFPSRKCRVGDVAREDVLEDELALAADRRPEARRHELASLQPVEHLVEVAGVSVEKRRHGTRPEHAPHDCRALERPLLIRFEQVDASREHALDRVRNPQLVDVAGRAPTVADARDESLVDQLAKDLLEEERVALGPVEDPVTDRRGQVLDGKKHGDQPVGV